MTTATGRFQDVITSEEALREVVGRPSAGALAKGIDRIDEHFAGFIGKSPFVLIASSDAAGHHDISPKGDPAGFVRVLDEKTLAIPDRPGNRRADTFTNVLQNPNVALYFLVPGVRETLRVQGKATLVRDPGLREQMAMNGKVPQLALVIDVEDAFMHCAKCMVRSQLWVSEAWPAKDEVPDLGAALVDQLKLDIPKEAIAASLEKDIRERLY